MEPGEGRGLQLRRLLHVAAPGRHAGQTADGGELAVAVVGRDGHPPGVLQQLLGFIEPALQGEDLGDVVVGHRRADDVAGAPVVPGAGSEVGERVLDAAVAPGAHAAVEVQVAEADVVAHTGEPGEGGLLVGGPLRQAEATAAPLRQQVRLRPEAIVVRRGGEDLGGQSEATRPVAEERADRGACQEQPGADVTRRRVAQRPGGDDERAAIAPQLLQHAGAVDRDRGTQCDVRQVAGIAERGRGDVEVAGALRGDREALQRGPAAIRWCAHRVLRSGHVAAATARRPPWRRGRAPSPPPAGTHRATSTGSPDPTAWNASAATVSATGASSPHRGEVVAGAPVHVPATPVRRALVRGGAHEVVAEREVPLVDGDEVAEVRRPPAVRRQVGSVEHPGGQLEVDAGAEHGEIADQAPTTGWQRVDPRREQALDGLGQPVLCGADPIATRRVPRQLEQEQRVPGGCIAEPGEDGVARQAGRELGEHQPLGRIRGQRRQLDDRVRCGHGLAGTSHDEHRRAGPQRAPGGCQHGARRLVEPVGVVDHQHAAGAEQAGDHLGHRRPQALHAELGCRGGRPPGSVPSARRSRRRRAAATAARPVPPGRRGATSAPAGPLVAARATPRAGAGRPPRTACRSRAARHGRQTRVGSSGAASLLPQPGLADTRVAGELDDAAGRERRERARRAPRARPTSGGPAPVGVRPRRRARRRADEAGRDRRPPALHGGAARGRRLEARRRRPRRSALARRGSGPVGRAP